jgi:hypothetical protein
LVADAAGLCKRSGTAATLELPRTAVTFISCSGGEVGAMSLKNPRRTYDAEYAARVERLRLLQDVHLTIGTINVDRTVDDEDVRAGRVLARHFGRVHALVLKKSPHAIPSLCGTPGRSSYNHYAMWRGTEGVGGAARYLRMGLVRRGGEDDIEGNERRALTVDSIIVVTEQMQTSVAFEEKLCLPESMRNTVNGYTQPFHL